MNELLRGLPGPRPRDGARPGTTSASLHDPLRRQLALGAGGALLLLAAARPARAVQVGQTLPQRWLDSAAGPQPLVAGRARLTYVDFWASWCAPCRQSFPWMNDLHAKFGGQGLRIVAVSVDAKRSDAEQFLARHPAAFSVVFDREGAFAKEMDVKTMPTSMLLDAQGKVLFVHAGFTARDREPLETSIAEALRATAALTGGTTVAQPRATP